MKILVEQREGALVLTPLFGRLDAAAAPGFRYRAEALIRGHQFIILDLSQLTFIDSSGLSTLVLLLKSVPPGSCLRLAATSARVRHVLRLTRLEMIFPSFGTIDDALRA